MSASDGTEPQPAGDRRWFLRCITAGALAAVTAGAHLLHGIRPAAALTQEGCCALIFRPSKWCPVVCSDAGLHLRSWACTPQGGTRATCKCYECTDSNRCAGGYIICSHTSGCCGV